MLTLDQAAEQFGKSRRTINRWIARGILPRVRMSHTSVFIREADMEKAIGQRTFTGPAPKPLKKGKTK
jgi:excisionase family DNA binding protein